MYLLTWISLCMAFRELAVTLASSSPHAEGKETPQRKTKAVIHTAVPATRLRESASTQAQNSDPQNLAEQVQSLTRASA